MLKKLLKMMKNTNNKILEDKPIDNRQSLQLENNYNKGFDLKYKVLFDEFSNIDNILDCYISNTIENQLFDDSKLKYIVKYIDSSDSLELEIDLAELVVLLENRVVISNANKFYNQIFEHKTDYNEILQTYITKTTNANLYKDLQINCLSEYLLNNGFCEDKLEYNKLRLILNEKIELNLINQNYDQIFQDKTTVNEILEAYIENTQNDELYDEYRIKYLTNYLDSFVTSKIEWSPILTRYSIHYCKNPELSINEIHFCDEMTNDKTFISILDSLEKEAMSWNSEIHKTIDSLIYRLIFQYGLEAIYLDVYIAIILKKSIELDLDIDAKTLKDFKNNTSSKTLYIECDIKSDDLSGEGICLLVGNKILVSNFDQTTYTITTYRNDIKRDFDITEDYFSDSYIFKVKDSSVTITAKDKEQLISFFEYINNEILEKDKEKISTIIEVINTASSELIDKTYNFVSIIPSHMLLDLMDFVAFECFSFHGVYENVERAFIDSGIDKTPAIFRDIMDNKDEYNYAKEFINSTFDKFIKVSGKYLKIDEAFHPIILWTLIKKSSIKYYSRYWNEKYNMYFDHNISPTDIDEWVDLYCRALNKKSTIIDTSGSFTYFLMDNNIFSADINTNFVKCNLLLANKILDKNDELELEAFEHSLVPSIPKKSGKYSISDIDLMNGHEFERFISKMFEGLGYVTEITRGSGDQGMDVIAEKHGTRIGIQAKCYSGKVTNKAVQEISAALSHYDCEKGIVVTNNYFTSSAKELATSNNIVLWDRDVIKLKIEELQISI